MAWESQREHAWNPRAFECCIGLDEKPPRSGRSARRSHGTWAVLILGIHVRSS